MLFPVQTVYSRTIITTTVATRTHSPLIPITFTAVPEALWQWCASYGGSMQ